MITAKEANDLTKARQEIVMAEIEEVIKEAAKDGKYTAELDSINFVTKAILVELGYTVTVESDRTYISWKEES